MNETVVILGNRKTCSYCQRFWGLTTADKTDAQKKAKAEQTLANLKNALPGCDVIDADQTDNAAAYRKYRPAGGFQWPTARIFDDNGKAIGQFVARNMTVASFSKKVLSICPSCGDDGASEETQETCGACGGSGKCPTCGGDGLVPIKK